MLLASRHLLDWRLPIPSDCVIRINLAWENDGTKLIDHLEKCTQDVFLDLPVNRTKPPHNEWHIDDLVSYALSYDNIRYLAISNVEQDEDVMYAIYRMPSHVTIVPKIETIKGIENIESITNVLRNQKIIMLDHGDLYTDLLKHNINGDLLYEDYINPLVYKCNQLNIVVLRELGLYFGG